MATATWGNFQGMVDSGGGTVTSGSPAGASYTVSATTNETIASGDGSFSFKVGNATGGSVVVGITHGTWSDYAGSFSGYQFVVNLEPGGATGGAYWLDGSYQGDVNVSYTSSDTFSFEISGADVLFKKNGSTVATWTAPTLSYPYYGFVASADDPGFTTLTNTDITSAGGSGGTLPTPTTDRTLQWVAKPAGVSDANWAKILKLVGPMETAAFTMGRGGDWEDYETNFVTYSDYHIDQGNEDTTWEACNYYDRCLRYFVQWMRTGDTYWYDRAVIVGELYLTYATTDGAAEVLGAVGDIPGAGIIAHNMMPKGVALMHILEAHTDALPVLAGMADAAAASYYDDCIANTNSDGGDVRIAARALQAFIIADLMGCTSNNSTNYATEASTTLTNILNFQDGTGEFPWSAKASVTPDPYPVKPFQYALMADTFAFYERVYGGHPKILDSVRKFLDLVDSTCWSAGDETWLYIDEDSYDAAVLNEESVPAWDLSLMIASAFAWYYYRTGQANAKTRALAAITEGLAHPPTYTGTKQFNEIFSFSFSIPWHLEHRQPVARGLLGLI